MNAEFMRAYFRKVTGHNPYNFQLRVAQRILSGRNVILQAPTGSGKTWASLVPFLLQYDKQAVFPRKLVYSLPLRVLANSLKQELVDHAELFRELIAEERKNQRIMSKDGNQKIVTLQTGETPEDRFFFLGDIVFTTIDQSLSSVLGIPLSLPQRLANINAGAIISSYLVFDEFHLLDPKRSLTTSVLLLKKLKDITPFCLMTATLSSPMIENLADCLSAEIVRVKKQDFAQLPNFKIEKTIHIDNEYLTAEKVMARHRGKTIILCNTVERCQQLYLDLRNIVPPEVALICIHSRFLGKDRKDKEKEIRGYFAKNAGRDANSILVSTQVIEVGMDISCNTMHTEISPINSFLQRIGRCARWEGNGEVWVYDVRPNVYGRKSYLPYEKELCRATFEELKNFDGKPLDYFDSQKIIDAVLNDFECRIFEEIQATSFEPIIETWLLNDKVYARDLIRDIRSISVVLMHKGTRCSSLYDYEAVSIDPHTITHKLNQMANEYEGEIPPLAMTLEESSFDDWDAEKTLEPFYEFDRISTIPIIALNPDYIDYSRELGLNFLGDADDRISHLLENEKVPQYTIKKDTYAQHIGWMVEVFERYFENQLTYTYRALESRLGIAKDFDEVMKFIIVMHDYGKLDTNWQRITRRYQELKTGKVETEWLAHTDFDPQLEEDMNLFQQACRENGVSKLPPHAGVGALVCRDLLPIVLGLKSNRQNQRFVRLVMSCIIQHHAAQTRNVANYKIVKQAFVFINEKLLREMVPRFYITLQHASLFEGKREDLNKYLIKYGNPYEAFLYFLLVRTLRLCDQLSFEKTG